MFSSTRRWFVNKTLRIFTITLLLGGAVVWLASPSGAGASGFMTWIDPGCYGPTTGHAEPGYHWWGQYFTDSGSGYASMTYGSSGLVSADPAGGPYRYASGSDVTINFYVGANRGIGRYTTTLSTNASFYSGTLYHTEFIDCY